MGSGNEASPAAATAMSPTLDHLAHLVRVIAKNARAFQSGARNSFVAENLYCAQCGAFAG